MAHRASSTVPQGSNRVPYDPRKLTNGSPKKAHPKQRPTPSNMSKAANGTRTGDAVSDESDNDDEEGEGDDQDDLDSDSTDEADAFALSGAQRTSASRLAGPKHGTEIGAVAGAAQDEESDDEYGAVDDIDDDDDEEEDDDINGFERTEEEFLRKEFLEDEAGTEDQRPQTATSVSNEMTGLSLIEDATLARRLSLQSEDSTAGGLDWAQDPFHGLQTNDSLYQELIDDAEDDFSYDLASWRVPDTNVSDLLQLQDLQAAGNEKRVRFAETVSSRSSSMSSEDDPRDAYPDLLDGASTSQSRAQYMMDIDPVDDDNESHFDFDYEDDYEAAIELDAEEGSDLDGETSDESDGDSTDEEDEADAYERMHAIHKQNSIAAARTPAPTPAPSTPSTPVTGKPPAFRRPTAANRPGKASARPRMGTFTHDPTRAAVTADENGHGVKIACPAKPDEKDSAFWEQARQVMGSRDGSPGEPVTWTRNTPHTASIPQRPFTAKMTLGSMFDGNLDFLRNNDVNGIANALVLPTPRSGSTRSSFTSTNTLVDDSALATGPAVSLEDLVQYPDSDSEMDIEQPLNMSTDQDVFATFTNDDSAPVSRLDNEDLLDHFDQVPGGIASFRNNQHHVRQVSSLAANPASRAQTSEANALQKGRRNAANAPITPGRKSRPNQDFNSTGAGVRKPLAHASPLAQKRRRSRGNSLSQTLALDRFGSQSK
ncbi:hypothetical protein Slin15195_G091100 [Septoria linicola]|uniref:Uncharacterized protein n=1 Tax=Septoria linicola TaxID=215465 RepID=A0A9Q9B206_9PEZI|nr:hypothetical protein Slin15195_G091100 [Septoria linicola]